MTKKTTVYAIRLECISSFKFSHSFILFQTAVQRLHCYWEWATLRQPMRKGGACDVQRSMHHEQLLTLTDVCVRLYASQAAVITVTSPTYVVPLPYTHNHNGTRTVPGRTTPTRGAFS